MIDKCLECLLLLLFMYAFYLLLLNGILDIQIGFVFTLQNIMMLCNQDLFICLFLVLQGSVS